MAAVARGPWLPRAWLCRRAGPGCGRHYRAALCAELKQPLAIEEVACRPVRPHEVRVDVHFCGVNFADILVCHGQYQEKPQLPFTPGMEFSGTVLETGTDVSTVKEGDRVIGVSGFNGMAEECIIDQKMLWQIPEGVPLREAAALPVSYGTAILALEHRARTRPGETVLVTAAAGATGLAVIDVATNVLQAQVIAAAGNDEKCKLARQKGAQSAVNYSQGGLKEAVRKLVGSAGVNVAIDTVGGDVFLEALRSLAWEGRIVVVGFAGGNIASVPANLLLLKNVAAMGLYWGQYKEQSFPVFSRTLSSALQYCQQGRIRPHIGAVFKLEESRGSRRVVKREPVWPSENWSDTAAYFRLCLLRLQPGGLTLGSASTVFFMVGAAVALVNSSDPKDLLKRWLPQKLDAEVWVMQLGSWWGVYPKEEGFDK